MAQVFLHLPDDFSPQIAVAACYIEQDGKLLLLRRAMDKKEGGFWGVPGGKVEPGESPLQAAARELSEETGIESTDLQGVGCLYIRKPEIDYTYHLFRQVLETRPEVRLNEEHEESMWAAVHELEQLPLMAGGREAYLHYCQALPGTRKPATASVSSYLILRQDDRILLGLRKNTGYCDRMWSFPAGHVEEGESASSAMTREAEEEIGIRPLDLKTVHVMHRQSNRWNIDVFFTASKWEGTIENKELDKCERLSFFPLHFLPENFVFYNRAVLNEIAKGNCYSEAGWI